MNKEILMDYIDACELVKETEADIRRLRKREVVHDKVAGSNPDFPYQAQNFNITGTKESSIDMKQLMKEQQLLEERKRTASHKKMIVEMWMKNVPARIQRIVRLKYFERLSWKQVAGSMGGNVTEESIRKEFETFLKNN